MRGLIYMASRDKVDVDTFRKGIQYALEKLGKSKFGFESTCLGADQKARGPWERDWICSNLVPRVFVLLDQRSERSNYFFGEQKNK